MCVRQTDIRDVTNILLLVIPGKPVLNLDDNQESENALGRLLQKRPDLEQLLRQKINLSAVFETWYESLSHQSHHRLLTEAVF